ncbi:PWWP domain-containing protein 1 [Lycium barbarum]|uniref:PWWP domain-containing protein 1 n=1 Tax=Lycium barbarum TaxID=112863 RepID=UPI00293F74C7|nr:PWWP domain-containing protein 1 [Lycium barbarum]
MISVMSNGFEPNRRNNDSLEKGTKLRVSSSSTPTDGPEEPRVSMDVNNSRVSNSQTDDSSRVLNLENEGNEIRVREVKDEEDVNSEKSGRVKGKNKTALGSSKTAVKKGKSEPVVSQYDLMLSKFDEYAGNVKSWSVGFGFEMGDMVWGKVKSHPWWPGHIFSEAFATPSVRRSKREGHILVAFYGDSSYGWFDPDELVHFEPTFDEKSVQTNVKTFIKAVEEGVDEVGRRSALGLVCHCRKRYRLRAASVNGFFAVDFSELEMNCTYSASQIKKAREKFQPKETLDFVRKLALKPRSKVHEDLSFVKKKATALAYRKAVFEEEDPTYAEAFGVIPSKQAQEVAQRLPSSRAPLSGRLVFADTVGKGKGSAKSNKTKDQEQSKIKKKDEVEKEKYLFKRRDEPVNLKVHQVGPAQAGSSDQPVHLDGSSLAGKDVSPSAADHLPNASGSTLIESFKQPSSQPANVEELHVERQAEDGGTDIVGPSVPAEARQHAGGSQVNKKSGSDKVKVRKRSGGEVSGGSSPSTERKKKKKKVASGLNANSNHGDGQAAVSSDNSVMERVASESVQVPSACREELQMDVQQKGNPADSSVPDRVGTEDKVGNRSSDIELPQVLSDLHAIALDPFYGAESRNINTIRELFLKFRSLVYQKSLALSAAVESESSTPVSKSPVAAPMSEAGPSSSVKQASNLKPQKNPPRPDDPTKGRKRGPSDRQEEMAVKKKKKINDLRALAAQKKASGKTSEVQPGESKEIPAKKLASTPVKPSKPDSGKKKEPVEKVPDPTMLVMKFPPNGSLPSISELKARFARFGTLDHSATRVFWKSSTCRLVYQFRDHAVRAFRFATGNPNLFGNTNVRCFIREVAAEAQDTETTTKVPRDDASTGTSAPKDGVADSRSSAKSGQLKSCLKKPPGEEGPPANGGNGSNRGTTRVKFMLGEEDNNRDRGEQTNDIKNVNNSSSIADGSASSSSNIINYTTQSSMLPLPIAQYANAPNDNHIAHQVAHRNVPNYNNQLSVPEADFSQQMLGLLTKCNDIVTNLTGLLGYYPYHAL